MNPLVRKLLQASAVIFGLFLALRYVFPLILPFLIGGLLALAAEPVVRLFHGKFHLRRSLAAGVGVSLALALLTMVVLSLCAVVIRELTALVKILPELEASVRSGMGSLSGWMLELVQQAPDGIRSLLTEHVTGFFSDGSALLDKAMDFLLALASGILSRVPGGALTLGTAVISSYMISAKLPQLRAQMKKWFPAEKPQRFFSLLDQVKRTMLGWLKAQVKLSGVTFLLALGGFFLLRVSYAPLVAALVAVVDAFPVLGTGTVLVPWSVVAFLQGNRVRAFGLLGLYGAAALTRSVLEPRLVGRQLGIDPLVTLVALYVGYQLFGFPGLILSPLLAVAVVQMLPAAPPERE